MRPEPTVEPAELEHDARARVREDNARPLLAPFPNVAEAVAVKLGAIYAAADPLGRVCAKSAGLSRVSAGRLRERSPKAD